MRNAILISLLSLIVRIGYSQPNLADKEIALNLTLESLRNAKNNDEIDSLNSLFKTEMLNFLKLDGAFTYPITKLKTIALLDSPDKLVRIVNWNLEYADMSYAYCAFVMRYDEIKEEVKITELIDKLDPYTAKPEGVIDAKNWYGALYYKILPIEYNGKTEYTLLGWDGGTSESNFKIIDVLSFSGNSVKLGSPVFKLGKSFVKRVVFEYSDKSSMSLKYDDKLKRIVYDHLSPEVPSLKGVYSYYVPDFSYDAFVWEEDKWTLKEDVIAINSETNQQRNKVYVLDEKTGKLKEKNSEGAWINPADPNKKNDVGHVARTPESEIENPEETINEPTQKKYKRDRRNPNGLSVTTGKYKRKKRNKRKP